MKPEQKEAWKDLVAVFSALIFVLVPGIMAMISTMVLLARRFQGSTGVASAFIVIPIGLIAMAIGMLIGQIIWMFLMSYFLELKAYDRWINRPSPYIPVIADLCMMAYRYFRQKKIEREE